MLRSGKSSIIKSLKAEVGKHLCEIDHLKEQRDRLVRKSVTQLKRAETAESALIELQEEKVSLFYSSPLSLSIRSVIGIRKVFDPYLFLKTTFELQNE